jgi:hypothetical protein
MSQTVVTQLLTLLAGAVLGIVGTAFKGYYDRREQSRRTETAIWLNLLTPLNVAAAAWKISTCYACSSST